MFRQSTDFRITFLSDYIPNAGTMTVMDFDTAKRRKALKDFQIRTGLKVAPWEKEAGLGDGTLRKYLDEVSHTMTDRTLQRLAMAATRMLGREVLVAEMLGETPIQGSFLNDVAGRARQQVTGAAGTSLATPAILRDLMVHSSAKGGTDDLSAMVISSEPVAYVERPAPLLGVVDGYAVYISGDSMSPAYESGDLAFVNPSLPPRPSNYCVFQGAHEDGVHRALLKRLVRETSTTWQVKQYEPPMTFSLQKSHWPQAHVVIGKFERI